MLNADMGRTKNLSTSKLNKATEDLKEVLNKFRKLSHSDQRELLLGLFKDVFENKTDANRYTYGKRQITKLFGPIGRLPYSFEEAFILAFEKEAAYLTKNKKKIPSSFLTLLAMNLINEFYKRSISFKDRERVEGVFKTIHDLSEISGGDFSDKELAKTVPLSIVDHVLKRAEYDLALKALIFRAEKKRLKSNFWNYCFEAANEWPYYLYNRKFQAETLFQYLYCLKYFKLTSSINHKFAYPPKRIETLSCIQALRKTPSTTGKIFTEIQAILDPDHSSNNSSISTEINN